MKTTMVKLALGKQFKKKIFMYALFIVITIFIVFLNAEAAYAACPVGYQSTSCSFANCSGTSGSACCPPSGNCLCGGCTTPTTVSTTTTIPSCGCCRRYVAASDSCVWNCTGSAICYSCACCTPNTYCGPNSCGSRPDGCGGTVNCGVCSSSTTSPGTTSPGTTSPGTTSPGTTSPSTTAPTTTVFVQRYTCDEYFHQCNTDPNGAYPSASACASACQVSSTTASSTTAPTTTSSTPTTTVPSTTTTSSGCTSTPCGDGRCAEDGGNWCVSGSCQWQSWGCESCASDPACSGSPDTTIPAGPPPPYGFVGNVYVDLDGQGDHDTCGTSGWPPTTVAQCTPEYLFTGEVIPEEYSDCGNDVNCGGDQDCESSYPICVPGTFCCNSGITSCRYSNDTDGYVKTTSCANCSRNYSCQETSVCCKAAKKGVTITATSLSTGATYSADSNSSGTYFINVGAGGSGQYDISVSSFPSGRYIVTSQSPVRASSDTYPYTSVDFGIYIVPVNLNITGYVFNDTDKDGTKNPTESCYEGTASITCCNSTNNFTVTACQPQTWCNCSDPNTIVTLHAPAGSTVRWSGTDSDGNPIGGVNTDASATVSIPE